MAAMEEPNSCSRRAIWQMEGVGKKDKVSLRKRKWRKVPKSFVLARERNRNSHLRLGVLTVVQPLSTPYELLPGHSSGCAAWFRVLHAG